jgi:hypothetical protein
MAKVTSNDTIKISGVLSIDFESDRIKVDIEDEGEIPLAELIQRFDNKEVSISVGYKEELY